MEEQIEYAYWEIWYISCEGNRRWYIARSPADWEAYQVREKIQMGGYDDAPAEIISIEQTGNEDYSSDYCD